MSARPPKQGWTRWRRPALWTLLAVGVLWSAVWFGGPPLLKSQIEKQGSLALGRDLRVGGLEVFPSRLAITFDDVTLAAAPGSQHDAPQLRIGSSHLDLSSRSLWRLAPVVEGLQIDGLRLRLTRLSEGHYDIDDLLARFASKPDDKAAQAPQHFALFNLQLRGGQISFDDRPVAGHHEVAKLSLDLPFLSNLPDDVQIKVQPHLSFMLDGSRFDIGGQSTPFAEGRASQFELHLAKLALPPWWAYVPKSVPLRLVGGTLDSNLALRFEQRKGGNRVVLSGSVDLDGVQLQDAADARLLQWQELNIKIDELLPLEQRLRLQSVALNGARLFVQRDATGQINLQRLLPGAEAAPPPAAANGGQPEVAGWQVQLNELTVDGAAVHWRDEALQPAADLALRDIALRLRQLQWPVRADADLSLDATLAVADKAMGELHVEGPLTDQQARLGFEFKGLQLAAAEPYLREWLRPKLAARLQGSGQLDWARGEQPRQRLTLSTLRLENLQLTEAAPAPRRGRTGHGSATPAQLASLQVSGLEADALQRTLQIASLQLRDPYLDLQRDVAGGLNVSEWLAPVSGAASPGRKADEAAAGSATQQWQLQLGELKVQGGRLRLRDAALGPLPLELRALDASVARLRWPLVRGQALQTRFSAQLHRRGVAAPARIFWTGAVGAQPLAARGRLRVERLPVQVFEPYFGADVAVRLKSAEAGFTGRIDLRQQGSNWVGSLDGDALLADVRVAARDSDDELLSWNSLAANGLKVALPAAGKPVVEVTELRLSDYYARLEITEQARFNLQQVAAGGAKAAQTEVAAPAAPVEAASAAARVSPWSKLPVDLQWGGVHLSNGRVDFQDHFIRPNYSAELSELAGRIGRFDTRATDLADVDLKGRVGGTGLLQISGAVNPTTEPPALDINAKASDIELPGLTPYAVKYAGYPIERGKLSVDVRYQIDPTGKLEANNHIILNQLSFGEKADSPDATSLPVLLAVALLQDGNGIIDIDLPVSGSINDPQFSLGGLIIKAIVNILTKAITAPFALLSGGGGPDLSVIGFAPGSAAIDPKSQEAIDKVAKALADRPALKLTITGEADATTEAEAMRRRALDRQIVAEQRRARARESLGKGAAADAALPPLNAEQRASLVKQLYVEAMLPDSPMTPAGKLKDLPAADMEARLLAAVPVDAATARQLGVERGRAVREALIAKGLNSDRLFLAEPKSNAKAKAKDQTDKAAAAASGPRAQLTLSPL